MQRGAKRSKHITEGFFALHALHALHANSDNHDNISAALDIAFYGIPIILSGFMLKTGTIRVHNVQQVPLIIYRHFVMMSRDFINTLIVLPILPMALGLFLSDVGDITNSQGECPLCMETLVGLAASAACCNAFMCFACWVKVQIRADTRCYFCNNTTVFHRGISRIAQAIQDVQIVNVVNAPEVVIIEHEAVNNNINHAMDIANVQPRFRPIIIPGMCSACTMRKKNSITNYLFSACMEKALNAVAANVNHRIDPVRLVRIRMLQRRLQGV